MAKTLTDRQFDEMESSIVTLRNRADRLRVRYANMVGIDINEYANNCIDNDPIYNALLAAAASFEEAYELLD